MALAIDSLVTEVEFSSASSDTGTISTTGADRILLAFIHNEHATNLETVASVTDTEGLTWFRRKKLSWTNIADAGQENNMEIWWAHAPLQITGNIVTFTLTGTIDDATVALVAVSGADVTFPWDAHDSTPKTELQVNAGPSLPDVEISTTATNTMLLGFWGSSDNINMQQGAGFTELAWITNNGGVYFSFNHTEYKIVSAVQTNAEVSAGAGAGSGTWGFIADALVAAGEGESEEVSDAASDDPESASEEPEPQDPSDSASDSDSDAFESADDSDSEVVSEQQSELDSQSDFPDTPIPPVVCIVVSGN